MDITLPEPLRTRFTHANEANLSAWLPLLGNLGRVTSTEPPGVRRVLCSHPLSLFNSLMETRLEPEAAEDAILAVQADARQRHVPVLWWISPSTLPVDLEARLLEHGFKLDEDGPAMGVELGSLKNDLPQPEGLSVRLAQDEAAWKEWTTSMYLGFEFTNFTEKQVAAWTEMLCLADPQVIQAYTGYLDGRAVATSAVLVQDRIAGIYCVTTLPEARRRGIGAWMTYYPLVKAQAMGANLGILQASEMGFPVYSSLGFQVCCRISSYAWRPE